MSAATLLDRLDRVRETGRGRWLARCPAHRDRAPSLSIRELDDGRVLVHCFAGCSSNDVLDALGLEWDSLFPERLNDRLPRERKPYSVRDLVAALRYELTLAVVVLADVQAGKPTDGERAGEAASRILDFLAELDHAG